MKNPILTVQKILFICFIAGVALFFISTIIFATNIYQTYLYGEEELLAYYSNELQAYNKQIFNFAIALVLMAVVVFICKPNRFYPTYITFPILVIIQVATFVLVLLSILKMTPILDFYQSYDYSFIPKLKDYQINVFFPLMVKSCAFLLMGVTSCSLATYSLGLIKYVKGKEEAYVS